jgi:hypothetical protein
MRLGSVRDAIVVIAIVVSSSLWFAHLRFYDALGIAPGDVGIGFAVILERSVGAVLIILVFLPAVALLLLEVAVPLVALLWHKSAPIDRPVWIEVQAVARPRPGEWTIKLWMPTALFVVFIGWVTATDVVLAIPWGLVLLASVVAVRRHVVIARRTVVRAAVILLGAASAVGALGFFWVDANQSASAARDGYRVERRIYGLPATAFRAMPTNVRIDGTKRCLLYLGASDGAILLYDHRRDVVERVPAGETAITLDRDIARCR